MKRILSLAYALRMLLGLTPEINAEGPVELQAVTYLESGLESVQKLTLP